MTSEYGITLKSMERDPSSRTWTVVFTSSAPYIYGTQIHLRIDDYAAGRGAGQLTRSPEETLTQARKELAVGLGVLAEIAHEGVDAELSQQIELEVHNTLEQMKRSDGVADN